MRKDNITLNEMKMIEDWIACYRCKKALNEPLDSEILSECSEIHYLHLGMDQILEPYIGNMEGFIDMISKSWGWSFELIQTEEKGHIFIDEQKDYCVCPLVLSSAILSRDLCECSRAFNKRMFERVIGKEVEVSLGHTYIRDKKSCQYHVTWVK